MTILSKVKTREARHYCLKGARDMGWTRAVFVHNIQSKTYEQNGLVNKQHNFEQALPNHQAEQADQAMKDVYLLGMLGVDTPILEAELKSRRVTVRSPSNELVYLRAACPDLALNERLN